MQKGNAMQKRDSFADIMILIFMMAIGAAEAAHLFGAFFHRPVSVCSLIFAVLLVMSAAVLLCLWIFRRRKSVNREAACNAKRTFSKSERLLLLLFSALVFSQILFMLIGKNVYIRGDMTVETVRSFLQTDGVYRVNPLTGRPYAEGLPSRIQILCLPTLYAAVSSIFHISPDVLVLYVIPVITLLCCYGAYGCLAAALFPENRYRRLCFLAAVAFLIWIGSYGYGMDGFGLIFTGWRGVTIRNAVLIPYAVSCCLRRKYFCLLLCVLAEACIVWTLYGMGVCLPVILGMLLVCRLRRGAGKEAADGGAC